MAEHSEKRRNLFWGFMIILLGVLLLLNEFDVVDIGDLWPLLIIGVGIWLILKPKSGSSRGEGFGGSFGDQSFITDTPEVIESNTFGDIKVTVKSKNFTSGRINTTFGDVKVDLAELEVQAGEQTLRLSTNFGDIKIGVPKNVPFSVQSSNTAGDMHIFDEKRSGWKQSATYASEGYATADKK
ncbi:hypothetical protein GF337_07750, partial [candidate division KSB1 bacterium]|nr:hypothetical protein [candidate division KSB1 bacterium]